MPNIQKVRVEAFINYEGKVLLFRRPRAKRICPEYFEMPGGTVAFGESLEKTLRKKVKSKTNLNIKIIQPYSTFSNINKNKQYIDIQFVVEILGQADVKVRGSYEEFRPVARDEIKNLEMTEKMRLAILKGFEFIDYFLV